MAFSRDQLFPHHPELLSLLTLYHKYMEYRHALMPSCCLWITWSTVVHQLLVNDCISQGAPGWRRLGHATQITQHEAFSVLQANDAHGGSRPPLLHYSKLILCDCDPLHKVNVNSCLGSGGQQRVAVTCMYLVHSRLSCRVILVTQSIFESVGTETRGTSVRLRPGPFQITLIWHGDLH